MVDPDRSERYLSDETIKIGNFPLSQKLSDYAETEKV